MLFILFCETECHTLLFANVCNVLEICKEKNTISYPIHHSSEAVERIGL